MMDIKKTFGKIEVEIEGLSPLLMHNIAGANLEKKTIKTTKKYVPEEEAEKSTYWMKNKDGKKELCVPARCILSMLLTAARPFRQNRMSVSSLLAGAIRIEPINVSLGTDKYEIDNQSVTVQKARIMRSRPRIDKWKLKFDIIYHREYIDPSILEKILDDAGFKVGLLDYRPQRKGPYGTFHVTKFEVIN